MWLFKRIKQNQLFGRNIEPNCRYCIHMFDDDSTAKCMLGKDIENGPCKKYKYDPFSREPKRQLSVKNDYDESDFKL